MSESEENSKSNRRLETYCGLLVAVFAAVLAIADLGGGRYGGDEMIAVNEKSSAYLWYQSKGIKHDLTEGRAELLKSLVASGAIAEDKKFIIDSLTKALDKKMLKYDKQKEEILLGSSKVGKENWVQEIDNEYGKVKGAKEWEAEAQQLGRVGDYFDGATFLLQLSIVMGAISLITATVSSKTKFFYSMIILGIMGSLVTFYAYYMASI
jgi:hypothetical protein